MTSSTLNITSSKRDFVNQIEARIRQQCWRIDAETLDAVGEQVESAAKAAADDPEWAAISDDFAALYGDELSVLMLNSFGYNRVVRPGERVRYESAHQYRKVNDWVWQVGGRMLELLRKHGMPEKPKPEPAAETKVYDECLYLSGAFATTRSKYWDLLFPPTKVFVEALKRDDLSIDELKGAVMAFSEALR